MNQRAISWSAGLLIIVAAVFTFVFVKNRLNERKDGSQAASVVNNGERKIWQEKMVEAAMAPSDCPAPAKRDWDKSFYQGPMIDAHFHIASMPDGGPGSELEDPGERPMLGVNITMADIVCLLDYEGTKAAFAFFPVWEPIIEMQIEVAGRTMAKYPDRFLPFIMPPDDDGSPTGFPTVDAKTLIDILAISPGLFEGYGEIGLYARGDRGGPKEQQGALALPPDSTRLMEIYPVVRENKLLVYFHLGEGQKKSYEKVLSANPDINFVFHGDQLIPYERSGQNLEHIADILKRHPNVFYGVDELYGDEFLIRPGVSKEEFIAHFKNYEPLLREDLGTWKKFIESHPDQVIWDTDRGAEILWSLDREVAITLNDYARAFIGRLDPTVQEKYAYKNAEKLMNSVSE